MQFFLLMMKNKSRNHKTRWQAVRNADEPTFPTAKTTSSFFSLPLTGRLPGSESDAVEMEQEGWTWTGLRNEAAADVTCS